MLLGFVFEYIKLKISKKENQIKGLDTDEAHFLTEIDQIRLKRERELRMEEKKEIEEIKISFLLVNLIKNNTR